MDKSREVKVSAETLRQMFNESGYWELVKSGALSEKLYFIRTPDKKYNEPQGTVSQILAYQDSEGRQVALVHQFLRKDGTLGGSGRPDPKKILYQGTMYSLASPSIRSDP
jgi:hypothetical protein